jgi:hypothetical protein
VFTREGSLVAPVEQDCSEQPDARAVHPEVEVPLALAIATTTYTKPATVLSKLHLAHREGAIPVFVVPPGEHAEDETAIARRVAKILDDPVKGRDSHGVNLYIGTDHVTFNGGAKADNGVTAVRPVTEDADPRSNHTRWRRTGGEFILEDEAGDDHGRVTDVDLAPKEQFPATYSVDPEMGTYTVTVPGELPRSYESEAAFREEWVPIKRPFIPEVDLMEQEYSRASYEILLLRDANRDFEQQNGELAVYRDGHLNPLEQLTSALKLDELGPPTAVSEPETADQTQPAEDVERDEETAHADDENSQRSGDPDEGVAEFASNCLVEDEGNVIPFRDVYEAYEEFIEHHQFEPKPDNHFTRVLKEEFPVKSTRKWLDGKARQCFIGVELDDELGGPDFDVADGDLESARTDGGESTDAR